MRRSVSGYPDGDLTYRPCRDRLNFFISRDLRRAALFLWITPLTAALSSLVMAARTASSSGVPLKIVCSALRTSVLTCDLYIWFRNRLCSFERIRFFAELVFAKVLNPFSYRMIYWRISVLVDLCSPGSPGQDNNVAL